MRLNKEIIWGVVEEELAEVKLRKKVREKARKIVKEKERKKAASQVLSGIQSKIKEQKRNIPDEYKDSLGSELDKLKERVEQLMKEYSLA